MKIKYVYISIFVALIFLVHFSDCSKGENEIKENDWMKCKTYEEFEKSVGGFPYTASQVRKNIMENYPKISLGISRQQVYELLGQPDVATEILPKFTFEKPKSRGWHWMYFIYKTDSYGYNSNYDIYFEVIYNAEGKVIQVIATNIDKLHDTGEGYQ